jgi:SpoIID/LytB domain protein
MLKISCFTLIIIFSLFFSPLMRAETTQYQEQLIRVGISSSDFSQLEYSSTRITADNNFRLVDLALEKTLQKSAPGTIYDITVCESGFTVRSGGKVILKNLEGPLGVESEQGHIKILDITRKGKQPAYRGKVEIVRAYNNPNKLSVVNVLPLDQYLKGVVPNELPVSMGYEALRAQAVAARNYAIRPREKPYDQFDICDSVMCQVYFGYYTENPISNRAVEETAGLVALYKGEVITTVYSSASGGCTENYEFAFSDPRTKEFPSTPQPYLQSVCDTPGHGDLSSESAARKFYTTSPASHDIKSGYYRWNRSWTGAELSQQINMNLAKLANTKGTDIFVKPAFSKTSNIGTLKNLTVLRRGKSGKAMELKIEGTNGSWIVQKELNIRRLLTKNGKALPSANIIIDTAKNSNGDIISVKIHGGGFGHGVGMSQYGASYMSFQGHKFDKILQHYYTGVALGTVPVLLVGADYALPIKQEFYSPDGKGILWVDNEGVNIIKLKLNGQDVTFDNQPKVYSQLKFDLSDYLKAGKNEVIYYPPMPEIHEGLSQKMWIEVVKAK